jgi:histidyl-tRNA synthetase
MKKQNLQALKGFRDFMPEEAMKRNWLRSRITEIFESWGYEPMETPTLESLELFEGEIGEDEKMFYKFEDQGGRKVAMRYDQTVPTCRVIGQNFDKINFPFRRYQIQEVFRAEKPQKGRYREFLQCDGDIFGLKGWQGDAEVIALSLDIYRQLGFKQVKVLVSDRSLLADFPYEVIVAIDKLSKIGRDGVIGEIERKGLSGEKAEEYLKKMENLKPNEKIENIFKYLENMGFDQSWYEFEPRIARSFAYSSGPIWEVVIPGWRESSVLGGERYDGLLERVSGRDIGGTGFGLGFDRTLEAMEDLSLLPEFKTISKVMVSGIDEEFLGQVLNITAKLREAGINTEVYPDLNTKMGKQFQYASRKKIPYVVVMGENEVRENKVTMKNMGSGEQEMMSLEEVIERLKD